MPEVHATPLPLSKDSPGTGYFLVSSTPAGEVLLALNSGAMGAVCHVTLASGDSLVRPSIVIESQSDRWFDNPGTDLTDALHIKPAPGTNLTDARYLVPESDLSYRAQISSIVNKAMAAAMTTEAWPAYVRAGLIWNRIHQEEACRTQDASLVGETYEGFTTPRLRLEMRRHAKEKRSMLAFLDKVIAAQITRPMLAFFLAHPHPEVRRFAISLMPALKILPAAPLGQVKPV